MKTSFFIKSSVILPLLLIVISCENLNKSNDDAHLTNTSNPIMSAQILDSCTVIEQFELEPDSQVSFLLTRDMQCSFLLLQNLSDNYVKVNVVDSNNNVIFRDYSKNAAVIDKSTLPEVYFLLKVFNTNESVNEYKLSFANDQLEPDSTPVLATELFKNDSSKFSFLPLDDRDYYKFTAQKDSCYQIILSNAPYSSLSLYSNDLLLGVAYAGKDSLDAFFKCLNAGTYYLLVSFNSSANQKACYYSISLKSLNDSYEPDNDLSSSNELVNGSPHMHTIYNGDVDWVHFKLKRPILYKVNLTNDKGVSQPVLFKFNNMVFNSNTLEYSHFIAHDFTEGTLYIKVGEDNLQPNDSTLKSNHGHYTVTLTEEPNDSYEPNNVKTSSSHVLINGNAINGKIFPGDNDWYSFSAEKGISYRIKANGSTKYRIKLFKPNGDIIKETNLDSTFLFQCDESGIYSLHVYIERYNGLIHSIKKEEVLIDYSISIKIMQNDTFEPDDSYENAKFITTDGIPQSRIFVDGEKDFIKFRMQKDSCYIFKTTGVVICIIYTLKDSLTYLAAQLHNGKNSSDTSTFYWTCSETDTYYICIIRADTKNTEPQEYSVSINTGNNDIFEYNNYPSYAKKIDINTPIQQLKLPQNDVDWIKFSPVGGVQYEITVANARGNAPLIQKIHFGLFSGDGNDSLGHMVIWNERSMKWYCPKSMDYLIRLHLDSVQNSAAFRPYIWTYSLNTSPLTQPNYAREVIQNTAQLVPINQTTDVVSEPGKQLWISFEAEKDSSYEFLVTSNTRIIPILYSAEFDSALITEPAHVGDVSIQGRTYRQTGFAFECKKSERHYIKFDNTDTIARNIKLHFTTYEKDTYDDDSLPMVMHVNRGWENHSIGIGDKKDRFTFEAVVNYTYKIEMQGKDLTYTAYNTDSRLKALDKYRSSSSAHLIFRCMNSGPVLFEVRKYIHPQVRTKYKVSVTTDSDKVGIKDKFY